MTGLGRERPNSETRRSPNIPNSAPELMSESPGNLLVEFCKGHISISKGTNVAAACHRTRQPPFSCRSFCGIVGCRGQARRWQDHQGGFGRATGSSQSQHPSDP